MRSDLPFNDSSVRWPRDWKSIDLSNEAAEIECASYMECLITGQAAASTYADELEREMCSSHKLKGRKFIAIAQSTVDPDDLLFFTDDSREPFAFVHLTWHVESRSEFPYSKTYGSLDEFFADCVENP
jgi:hypothetical protein